MNVPRNLCNDLNRLAMINLITYGASYLHGQVTPSFRRWKDGFLRDIAILMVYHQLLSYIPNQFGKDADMVDDFVKTGSLLIVPHLFNGTRPNYQQIGLVLGGVVLYHKVVRLHLVRWIERQDMKFDIGLEDLVETVLLLSMTRTEGPREVLSQLAAIAAYHTYLKY